MTKPTIEQAINVARRDDYLRALNMFVEVYGEGVPSVKNPKDAAGLSYFALTVALVKRDFRNAIEICKRAITLEFYNGDHHANLSRIYLAAGNRKKAVETADAGLKVVPEHEYLTEVRKELGVRARPAVPVLARTNPINVSLGQARHAKKLGGQAKKK
jgi:tetratricopeptide (TPR) repeat protein